MSLLRVLQGSLHVPRMATSVLGWKSRSMLSMAPEYAEEANATARVTMATVIVTGGEWMHAHEYSNIEDRGVYGWRSALYRLMLTFFQCLHAIPAQQTRHAKVSVGGGTPATPHTRPLVDIAVRLRVLGGQKEHL